MNKLKISNELLSTVDYIHVTLKKGQKYKIYGPYLTDDNLNLISDGETYEIKNGEESWAYDKMILLSDINTFTVGSFTNDKKIKKEKDNLYLPQMSSRNTNKELLPYIIFFVIISLLVSWCKD